MTRAKPGDWTRRHIQRERRPLYGEGPRDGDWRRRRRAAHSDVRASISASASQRVEVPTTMADHEDSWGWEGK